MHAHPFEFAPISRQIWETKYRLTNASGGIVDRSIDDTWSRVAHAAAAPESGGKRTRQMWADRFQSVMSDFVFLPAGRIIAGAGTKRDVTLFNCFVMGAIEDDLGAIFDGVKEAARTMQLGGGIGHDFSTLRPKGALVRTIGADASGPVSFMDVWDAMCRTIMSAGARRGAMMGTLRCDHPDIEEFIEAKSKSDRLRNFNISVLVTDAFIDAVRNDADWDLVFGGKTWRTVKARHLWDRIIRATYDYAEPGVIFIDRINAVNNLAFCEEIRCTNPCGEQPLPPYGACLLGSINLARLVSKPFSEDATIDVARLEEHVQTAVRFLDNIIDVSKYPLPAQRKEAKAKRRLGLGVTGLADALLMCGQSYGSNQSAKIAEGWMKVIQSAAYRASTELAAEKDSFPLFDAKPFLDRPNVAALEPEIRKDIERHGIRNGCLTSIAPTGTISLLAGNVSSGIEPIFAQSYTRRVLQPDGSTLVETVEDYACALYRQIHGPRAQLPANAVTSADLTTRQHLKMQAALQRHVDSSISKTINCPTDMPFDEFKSVYMDAYDLGLKGCTTFRPNGITGAVLSSEAAPAAAIETANENPVTVKPSPVSAVDKGVATTADNTEVVMLTRPLERDAALPGFTYKLKWPGSPDAIYVTINDIEREGRRCPFEIFINTKNLEHYAWTVALTRMISAVFRRGGDVSFVVEELKAIFDPQGGRWIDGRYVPSLLAAIGEAIETHMIRIGFLQPPQQLGDNEVRDQPAKIGASSFGRRAERKASGSTSATRTCPQCGAANLARQEGCWVCLTCGYSHCG